MKSYSMHADMSDKSLTLAALSIAVVVLCYLVYLALSRKYPLLKSGAKKEILRRFALLKLSGFILFGIVPAIIATAVSDKTLVSLGTAWPEVGPVLYLVPVLMLLLVFISYKSAHNPEQLKVYPEIRLNEWRPGILLFSIAGWAIYLFGYEFMMRGFLLYLWLPFGTWLAIGLNMVIYSLIHLAKGARETISSLPFGLVLCLVTLYTGSFLPAFILHLSFAISSEIYSIRYNRGMRFVTKPVRL